MKTIPNDQLALLNSIVTVVKNKERICNGLNCNDCVLNHMNSDTDMFDDQESSLSLCDVLGYTIETVNNILRNNK